MMAGVAGSQPQDISSPVPQAPVPKVNLPEAPVQATAAASGVGGAPQPQGTPAPQPDAPPPQQPSLDDIFQAHAQAPDAAPAGKPSLDDIFQKHADAPAETSEPGLGMKALDAASRVLDYPGGIARTAIAKGMGVLAGHPEIVNDQDALNAFKGKAPNSSEYMKRMDVGEGPSYDLPGIGHISSRDVAGAALDIATDPLTAVSKLAKEVPYIGKLMNVPGATAEWAGNHVYNSAFKKVDAALAKKGSEPLSELMRAEGATGSAAQLQEKAASMANDMGKFRQTLYDKADQLGAKIDLAQPGLTSNADKVIAGMKQDRGMAPQAVALEELLNQYKKGTASLAELSAEKTNLYNALPATMFDANGKSKPIAKRFKAALALDMKRAIEQAGNGVEKGLGDAINETNNKWGRLIESQKPLQQMAGSSGQGHLGTAIDGALLASGHWKEALGKHALQIANGPYVKTKVGQALAAAGQNGVANALANRTFIDSNQDPSQKPQEP